MKKVLKPGTLYNKIRHMVDDAKTILAGMKACYSAENAQTIKAKKAQMGAAILSMTEWIEKYDGIKTEFHRYANNKDSENFK